MPLTFTDLPRYVHRISKKDVPFRMLLPPKSLVWGTKTMRMNLRRQQSKQLRLRSIRYLTSILSWSSHFRLWRRYNRLIQLRSNLSASCALFLVRMLLKMYTEIYDYIFFNKHQVILKHELFYEELGRNVFSGLDSLARCLLSTINWNLGVFKYIWDFNANYNDMYCI